MSKQETVVLVDEKDNALGYKSRSALEANDRYRISSIWIENSKGQVLIAQRADTRKTDPGCWGPAAAGTVNQDESYEQNALKELKEEIGVNGVGLMPYIKVPYISSRGHHRVCQWFKVSLDWPVDRFNLQEDEVKAVRWIDKHELGAWLSEKPEEFVASAQFWPKWFNLSE